MQASDVLIVLTTMPDQNRAEAQSIYELLEGEIIPTFYERGEGGLPRDWLAVSGRIETGASQPAPWEEKWRCLFTERLPMVLRQAFR